MRKIIAAVFLIIFLITGCKSVNKNNEPKKLPTHQSAEDKEDKKKNTNTDNSKKVQTNIKDESGKNVTSEELNNLIEKANDPSTDEKTKQELLNKIDYILKQVQ